MRKSVLTDVIISFRLHTITIQRLFSSEYGKQLTGTGKVKKTTTKKPVREKGRGMDMGTY